MRLLCVVSYALTTSDEVFSRLDRLTSAKVGAPIDEPQGTRPTPNADHDLHLNVLTQLPHQQLFEFSVAFHGFGDIVAAVHQICAES